MTKAAALLLLAAATSACVLMPSAPPGEPIAAPSFDTAAWVQAVGAAETEAERIALSNTLLDAVDWRTACGEDDPTTVDRGVVRVLPVDGEALQPEGRTLADVTCQRLDVARVFALVDLAPGRTPRLVQAFGIGDDGRPTAEPVPGFYGVPTYASNGARRFDVVTPAVAGGGCGLAVRYRLADAGGATIEYVRLYEACDAPLPVTEWPVTYAAP